MFKRIAIISALVLFSLLLIYCTTDETTVIGPFGDASKFLKITEFTAEVDTLFSKGDSTEIQIKIIDIYGHPVDKFTVNLSAQIGDIPEKVVTDSSGVAKAIYKSGDKSGLDLITANAGIKKASLFLQIVDYVPYSIDLSSETPVLLADGISKATITATPRDETGNIMPGISVMFSTTKGTLSSTIALTDGKGEAKVELTSSTSEGTALVVATSYITSFLEVKFRNYVPHFMEIYSDKSVLVADGVSTATITATPKDSAGVPMVGVNVQFSSNIGALSPVMDISNSEGKASTILSAGDIYGTATVTATASVNNSVNIEFITYSPTSISLSAGVSNASILANGLSSLDISATVKNTIGELVGGVRVVFSTTAGTLNKTSDITNSEGVASVSLTSSGAISDNTETITATIDGTSISDNIGIRFRGITLSTAIDSSSIHNDGKFVVYVTTGVIETSNGVPVTGVATNFSTTQGELTPTLVALNQNGIANSILVTDITSLDQSGIFVTSALSSAPTVNAQSQEITIPGLEILLSTLDDDIVGDGVSTTAVRGLLRKVTGNVSVPFKRISWQTDPIGTIVESSVTNFLGETVDTVKTEFVNSTQTVTITANFGENVENATPLTFLAPKPEKLILGFEPDITAGPCIALEDPDTCVFGVDSYGNIIVGPEGPGAIYCGHPDETWCYRLCGQDLIKAGSWGTRDISVTALFKNVLNNPIRHEGVIFWLAPENAPAVICESDNTTNNNGRAHSIITYSIQYAGEVVRVWARVPTYDVIGYIDIKLPPAF